MISKIMPTPAAKLVTTFLMAQAFLGAVVFGVMLLTIPAQSPKFIMVLNVFLVECGFAVGMLWAMVKRNGKTKRRQS
jgi:hypothetical protein